jgi:hypothetical protein
MADHHHERSQATQAVEMGCPLMICLFLHRRHVCLYGDSEAKPRSAQARPELTNESDSVLKKKGLHPGWDAAPIFGRSRVVGLRTGSD